MYNGRIIPKAKVSIRWVPVSGFAEVVLDVAKQQVLWNAPVETFAEYRENPGGAASLVAGWAKQELTGKPAEPGGSSSVGL